MGLTNNLGRLSDALTADGSLNVGVGASPNASYKLDVTGAGRYQDNLLVSKNQNAGTILTISNTTSGTAAAPILTLTSDASSGNANFGKYSTTTTAYKIVASKDAYLYNGTTGGDISILNDFASGTIKFAAGASTTAQLTIAANGTITQTVNQNGGTSINASNTTSGVNSQVSLGAISDASAGSASFGKYSTASTAYKIITAKNAFIYNSTIGGDIAILNDFATGTIKFAAGGSTTAQLTIAANGNITQSVNQNAATGITVSNTTSGTASQVFVNVTSDASAGDGGIGKYSTTKTAYKIIAAKDLYLFNSTTGGDFAFLNDFASGTIKFAAGGSSTAQVTIGTTGLTTFATGVDYKRLNPTTTTTASTATLTPDISAGDTFTITAQAASLSLANPTGTPVNGQKMIIRIKDNGTARAITFSGTQYRASSDLAFPTTTIVNKTLYMGFIWNSTDSKWDMLASLNNF